MSALHLDESAIFEAARKMDSQAAREAFLRQVCADNAALGARVRALLKAHEESASFLEAPAAAPIGTMDVPVSAELPGTMIGAYKLLQQIGEGGMGTVFMAEQTHPVQRMVALKVIKAGMDSKQIIARFEAERQALAVMDHVNIARVFDGGATEAGRPYFVMELVHGVPITRYCDDNQLTPRERLELFVPVCQAIQHAHQKGIIHRDVKPSNVMVTLYDGKPVPKVIDFGVAKATEHKLTERTLFTHYGTMVGTLEYVSPEQAEMSAQGVDTRSDIYSLGVLLYELLTGSTPLGRQRVKEAAHAEILRLIREVDPPRPSTRLSDSGAALASISAQRKTEPARLSKLMRGELDWIVMKTLEKDRNRRYETANGLAIDVQRYLNDEAVQACPPSAAYRFRKFARRNRVALITAALVSAALVLGTLVSTWQAILATRARGEAETARTDEAAQRKDADQRRLEADEQRQQAEAARKEATLNLQKAREAVDQMLTRVADEHLANTPQMELVRKALFEDALMFYQRFLQKTADPALRLETGRAWERVGFIHAYFDQHAEAAKARRESVRLLEDLVIAFPGEPKYREALAESCISLGNDLTMGLGRGKEAQPVLRRALDLLNKIAAERPGTPRDRERLARARHALAETLGRTPEAEKEYRKAIDLAEKLADQFPTEPGYREHVAEILFALGRRLAHYDPPEAEKVFRQALPMRVRALAENPNSQFNRFYVAWNQECLAILLHDRGQLLEAEEFYLQAIEGCERVVADFPNRLNYRSALCGFRVGLGKVLEAMGRSDEAEQTYRLTWTVTTGNVAPNTQPPWFWFHRLRLGQARLVKLLTTAGRTQEVEQHYQQALALWEKLAAQSPTVPRYSEELWRTYDLLGDFLAADMRPQDAQKASLQAITVLEESLKLQKANLTPDDADAQHKLGLAFSNLAGRLANCPDVKLRKPKQAVELAQTAIAMEPRNGRFWRALAYAHYRAGDWKACMSALEKASELQPSANNWSWVFQAMAHWQLGNKDRVRQYYKQAVDWMAKNALVNEELERFRAEAAALLGVADQPNRKEK